MPDDKLRLLSEALKDLNEKIERIQGGRPIIFASTAFPPSRALVFDVETPDLNQQIYVNKKYYRIDFVNETESSVEIRISRKNV